MRVLGYGTSFKRAGDVKEEERFFPELYSWGKNNCFYFRIRRVKPEEEIQMQGAILPILELKRSEYEPIFTYGWVEEYREDIKELLKFYLIEGLEGICLALYRNFENYDYQDQGEEFAIEVREKVDGAGYTPLLKLRLRNNDFIYFFENGVIRYFILEAYKQGWSIRFI